MALSQSALSELLEAIRAGDGTDVLRDAMALVLQELIELEATQAIGAGRYERTDEHHPPQRQPDPPALDQGRRCCECQAKTGPP
jgi:transposase-like protein